MFAVAKMKPDEMWRTRSEVHDLRVRMNERAKKMIVEWLEKKGVAVETEDRRRRRLSGWAGAGAGAVEEGVGAAGVEEGAGEVVEEGVSPPAAAGAGAGHWWEGLTQRVFGGERGTALARH